MGTSRQSFVSRVCLMKEQIKELIYRRDNVSFAELMCTIPESSGERAVFHHNDSLVLWEGVSDEFSKAIQHLIRDREIIVKPTIIDTYLADRSKSPGGYPVAKKVRRYVKPHWFPAVLCRP